MIIPREGDVVRLYIQLTDTDVVDASGRVDKSKMGPQRLLEVANKSFHPYKVAAKDGVIEWWTIYISEISMSLGANRHLLRMVHSLSC